MKVELKNKELLKIYNQSFDKISKKNPEKDKTSKSDSLEISDTARVYNKIDSFLNLGKPDRLDISDLSEGEKEEFFKIMAKLLKEGIVGYEYLEVDGKKEKHYIVNQLKNDRIRGAELWDEERNRKVPRPYLDKSKR